MPVRVLIADDQGLMAAGTAAAVERGDGFELVGTAASAADAGGLAAMTQPDVALVYVHVEGGLGVRLGQGYHVGRPEPLPIAA